jgi:hypothetical protein
MKALEKIAPVRVNAPSPLVGEGITAGQRTLSAMRGSIPDLAMPRQPLTRLRFAQPPSPTRGEGKKLASHVSQTP